MRLILKLIYKAKIFLLLVTICMLYVEAWKWLGYSYWSDRYGRDGIQYKDHIDSGIWWNDYYDGRHAYEPKKIKFSSCGPCTCTNVINCSETTAAM